MSNFDDTDMNIEGKYILDEQEKTFKRIFLDGQKLVLNNMLKILDEDGEVLNEFKTSDTSQSSLEALLQQSVMKGIKMCQGKIRGVIEASLLEIELEECKMNTTQQAIC